MASNMATNMAPNMTTVKPPANTTLSIDNLYPAIFQCFAIIMAGYIAGRANLINQSQGNGIGVFVGKFCLPALLFRSMVTLNFSQVDWYFLLGITISKTAVFVAVAGLTLLIKRPIHLGFAGLFAIFATQSNDFALGYPILKALYSESHPEFLQYIYLVAPISLVLLNPIGFTLLEIHRRSIDGSQSGAKCRVVLHVIKDVITNPIVFMVLVGIGGNFLFKQKVPNVLDDILKVLGNAYSASALFYLGLSLVGKVQGQLGVKLIVPLLLIGAKTLLLPLITWQVVGALELGRPLNDSRSLSMYGFLYGTFPTAPSVFLYASHFSVAQDIIATGMVVCTFLSAPLMFVSAKMMTVVVNSEMDYKSLLLNTSFDISVVSVVCNMWILAILFLSRKHKKMPHQFLVCLVLAQTLACIGMIIYDGLDTKIVWQHYLQFVVLLVGVFSTRCFAAVISLVLYLLHCRSLCFVLRYKFWMYLFGFGFPVFSTGLLLIFGNHHMHNEIDPSFHYGLDQAVLSVVILGTCSVINITFLVLRIRNSRAHGGKDVLKVKSKFRGQKGGHRHGNLINTALEDEEEALRENLLSDTDQGDTSDYESPQKTRSSSSTKLLNDTEEDNNRYRSLSCSNCTSNCEVNLYKEAPVKTAASNIEDIVPFPENMQRKHTRTNSGRFKINSSSKTSKAKCSKAPASNSTALIDNSCTQTSNAAVPKYETYSETKSPVHEPNQTCNTSHNEYRTYNSTNQHEVKHNSTHGVQHITVVDDYIDIDSTDTPKLRGSSSSSSTSEDSMVDTVQDYECHNGTCSYQQRRKCAGLLRCYQASTQAVRVTETSDGEVKVRRSWVKDDYQTDKFLILLLFLQISMFMGLFLCTWRLFNQSTSGIYVEIEFLDGFFNYGQSLVVFAIFGFDTKLMILPCIRRWRKWLYGVELIHIPDKTALQEEDKHMCEQFVNYHRDNCQHKIVRDMKYRLRTYRKVFCGTSLCDWLIEVGLCRDRQEAILYGRTLLRGQVIGHVTLEHDFHDMPYFYRFLDEDDE